jgi:hypothetical protein
MLVLKWFLHLYKGLLVGQGNKELRLVESQEKEDHINVKGAISLDI